MPRTFANVAYVKLLGRLKAIWNYIFDGALWISGVTATLVAPPFFLEDSNSWVRFARFVVAFAIGVFFIPAVRWRRRTHTKRWLFIAIALFSIGIIGFSKYQHLTKQWSVPYVNSRKPIGRNYTDLAQNYRNIFQATNGYFPEDKDLVWRNAGTGGLWPDEEIEERRGYLAAIYILIIVSFSCSMMSLAQALACNTAKT